MNPSSMSIRELKEAIEARGLTSRTIGFAEKHEFVTLLTEEINAPIIKRNDTNSNFEDILNDSPIRPIGCQPVYSQDAMIQMMAMLDTISGRQVFNDFEQKKFNLMADEWEKEKKKKKYELETEIQFQDNEFNAKYLYLCKRFNEKSRLEGLLNGPLASADLNAIKDEHGRNGLIVAAFFDNDAIIDLLLKYNLNIDSTDDSDYTALIHASTEGSYNSARILVKNKCNINYQTTGEGGWGFCALTKACARGHMNIVKLLVENGANVNIQEANGFTPVIEACRFGHVEIALYLMRHGADIRVKDGLGRSIVNLYGKGRYPPVNITKEMTARHLQLIHDALQYLPDKNWERRKYFIQLLVENGYLSSPPAASAPVDTKKYHNIFESIELTKLIVSYI